MPLYAISFLLGCCSIYLFSGLSAWWTYLLAATGLWLVLKTLTPASSHKRERGSLITAYKKNLPIPLFFKGGYLVVIFLLGLTWVMFCSHKILSWTLPSQYENTAVTITGAIASIPINEGRTIGFVFAMQQFNQQAVNTKIRLNWYSKNDQTVPQFHVGDQWRFTVRLKRPHNLANPGSFDTEKFLFSQGIRATGYIINDQPINLLSSSKTSHWIDRIREKLLSNMQQDIGNKPYAAFIYALTVGEKFAITAQEWQVFQNTGTNHLMAIAGLHIGFVAGLVFLLSSFIWKRIPRAPLLIATPQIAAIVSLISAIIYSALAGFAIPTQRAVIMLSVFLLSLLLRRFIIAWQSLSLALLAVLIWSPLSVLEIGFWLSFAALSLIIFGLGGRLNQTSLWWKHGRMQWVISIGLIPLTLLFFANASLVSPLANALAIPWVGFITVPLSLMGALLSLIFPWAGKIVLIAAEWTLHWIWDVLRFLAEQPELSWQHLTQQPVFIISAILGMLLLLAPRGLPCRYLGICFIAPLVWFKVPAPAENQLWFTLLDVGQGLSAVVQTHKHTLIFDTGAKFSADYNMGSAVVIPFLRYQGITKIDKMVISHGDNDHIGGAAAILQTFPVTDIETSVPDRFPAGRAHYCLRDEQWQWDGVTFQYLYPSQADLGQDNNSSCVLKISVEQQAILLTGDIEKPAEEILLQHPDELPATILIAPHHGSDTSSTPDFINAVHPQIVLYPVGYLNKFGFPKPIIITRYQTIGATSYDTATDGAIELKLNAGSHLIKTNLFRINEKKHVWNQN